jgi:hypothetical protein
VLLRNLSYCLKVCFADSLNTRVAFDNFDLFVETLTGKDTLYCNAVVAASLK